MQFRTQSISGLLIFWVAAELQNSGKSAKSREIRKNMQNTVKFGRNLIKYMSVQQFWKLLGVFTCHELANLCQNFVTEMCKQCSVTTRRRLYCKKLGTSHDVKGFAIGSFLERIVVGRAMTSVRKTLKMPVWSEQNWSISSEICPENNPKIRHFLPIAFEPSLPQKFPQNSREISWFFHNFVFKNPTKFDFFFRDLSEALSIVTDLDWMTLVDKIPHQRV